MQITKILKAVWLCAALMIVGLATTHAQTIWTNKAGGDWNTAINWSNNLVPIETTNVFITNGTALTVTYTAPMAASSVGSLTLGGFGAEVLTISAGGFNVSNSTTLNASSTLNVIGGGVMTNGTLAQPVQTSAVIVNGGTMTNGTTQVSNNGSNDGGPLMISNNAVANLGVVTIRRSAQNLFSSGLTIRNSTVTANTITIGNNANSYSTMSVGGYGSSPATTVTANTLTVGNTATPTIGRYAQFMQTNGTVTVQTLNMGAAGANTLNFFTVQGSAVFNVGSILLFPNAVTTTTNNFTNTATIYVGSGGFTLPNASGNTYNISLNNLGLFGASADWSGGFDAILRSGTFTFQAADSGGIPHNITLNGGLRGGTGALSKTGGGTLTFNGTNIYLGSTIINNGILAIGATGTLSNSTPITVGSTGTFDVSAVTGGFILNAGQTLGGSGVVTGAVAVASGGIINPGNTLNFSNTLTETGAATNHFDLAASPGPTSDLINIASDLTASGTNTLEISGGAIGVTFPLVHYGGNFNGGITNFTLTGATGTLTNNVATKTISVTLSSIVRSPTNMVWLGNTSILNNNWDMSATTNWSNGGVLDTFIPGDFARFDNTGAVNPLVNIPSSVTPGSITVDTTSNYTFTGSGSISGSGGLIKTNSGTLTILTTNNYTGPTVISGGTLEALIISNGLSPSSIGAANTATANLILTNNGVLRYIGNVPASTDRGITLDGSGGTIAVTNGSTLTLNADFVGTGTLTKTDNGELVLNAPNGNTGGTVVNGGILTLANTTGAGAGAITNNNGVTLKIASPIVGGATTIGNALYFNGTVTIDLNNLNGTENLDGAWSGNATVNVINQASGQIFTIGGGGNAGGTMLNFVGTINAGTNSGSFRFNDSAHQNMGSTNLTLDLGTGSAKFLVRDGGFTYDIGALKGGVNTSLTGRGSAGATATYSIGGENIDTEFDGTIVDGAGSNPTAITKVGTGTLTLAGHNTYSGSTTISNGVLALINNPVTANDASIDQSSTINILPGTFLDASGRNDGTLQLGSVATQLLEGRGTIRGSLFVNGGGTVSPGGGIGGNTGTLTVTNSVNLYGTALMKLNRANTPNSDQIVSTLSSITCGNALVVTNIGVKLHVGDTFTLFSSGSTGGGFGSIAVPNYYTWDTSQVSINGTISVLAILPPPSITNVDYSGLAGGSITINANNGALNGPVTVLTSTNLALPLSSWTTVTSTTFDGSGNLSLPITVDPTLPQSFYILKAY